MARGYVMIRYGDFGNCGRKKIIFSIFGYMMASFHSSYMYLFLTATVLWGSIEYLLVLFNMRKISLLVIDGRTLNPFVSAILRGGQEGGFVTIFSFIVGDLLAGASFYTWLATMTALFYFFLTKKGGDQRIRSIRAIFTPVSVGIMTVIFVMNLYFLSFADNTELYRIGRFMFVMFSISSFWTFGQVRSGKRKVMWMTSGRCGYCSLWETLMVFVYDIVIEICSAYLIFYFIVYYLFHNI